MKTLDLKRGVQGEFIGSAALINEIVNEDGLDPSLHLDFSAVGQIAYVEGAEGPQYQRNIQLLDAVCARASRATNVEWDFTNGGVVGQLTEMEANSVRWNHIAGLFQEGARTNSIRNPRAEGAVAGGSVPTTWSVSSGGGTGSAQIVSSGYLSGLPYVRIRFSGTPVASPTIGFDTLAAAATTGQTWTSSVGLRVQSGGFANITGLRFRNLELDESAAGVDVSTSSLLEADALHRRFIFTDTLAGGAATAGYQERLEIIWDGSGAIDITLDIFAPQLELGSTATSPILPPIGSPAASTRAAETVTNLATVTRSSRKSNAGEWDFTNGGKVGAYREYLPNVPAITGKGILTEPSTTNLIRNPHGVGGSTGADAGSRAPTHWLVRADATSGMNPGSTVHEIGYRDGWPIYRVTLDNSANASVAGWYARPEAAGVVSAVQNDIFTLSMGLRLVSGSLSGSSVNLRILQKDSGGGFLTQATGPELASLIDRIPRRFSAPLTADQATVAHVVPELDISVPAGGKVEFIIYGVQLEKYPDATSPIFPAEGVIGAATRATDVVSINTAEWLPSMQAGTIYAEYTRGSLPIVTGGEYIWEIPDSVRLRLDNANNGTALQAVISSSTSNPGTALTSGASPPNVARRVAFSWGGGSAALTSNGVELSEDPDGVDLSSIDPTVIKLMGAAKGSTYLSQLRVSSRRTPNAELETLVGN